MKTRTAKLKKVAMKDQEVAGRKAKNVKGGPIYMSPAGIAGWDMKAAAPQLFFKK